MVIMLYLVYNELYDFFLLVCLYGIVGWFENDCLILIYDVYDIWVVDFNGRVKLCCLIEEYGC